MDLEALRQFCAAQLGDQVVSVRSTERDHGFMWGIAIETPDGWRHAVALAVPEGAGDISEAAAAATVTALQIWLNEKRRAG